MAYSTKSIANYFLSLAKRDSAEISPMKLQKLIYFAHGWHLAIFGKPLIDELIQAWRYGPVIKSIYHEFKHFGNGPITEFATSIEWDPSNPNGILGGLVVSKASMPEDQEVKELLNKVWEVYGKFTAIELSNITHEPGTPWATIWHQGIQNNTEIDNELIRDYFIKKASKRNHERG